MIEDILRIKSRLKLEGQSKENILDGLNTLSKKVPPRNVLKSTKIGKMCPINLSIKTVVITNNQCTVLMDSLKINNYHEINVTLTGHTINKLTKHEDSEVSTLASDIVKEWKRVYEEKMDRPMIEVKSDHQTQKIRDSGRRLLSEALKTTVSN